MSPQEATLYGCVAFFVAVLILVGMCQLYFSREDRRRLEKQDRARKHELEMIDRLQLLLTDELLDNADRKKLISQYIEANS